jgi:hypothetical protein
MNIEHPGDEFFGDSIEILYPGNQPPTLKADIPKVQKYRATKNTIMADNIDEFKKKSMTNVAQTFFLQKSSFNMKVRNIVLRNFRSEELFSKQMFLNLIVFRPENIYELDQSFFFFDKDLGDAVSGQSDIKFFYHKVKPCSSYQGYLTALGFFKAELVSQISTHQMNIVCYFEQIFILSVEELENLIFLISEDIVEQFPHFRFTFLINIIEKYQLTFRMKGLHLERIDFESKDSLFYEALVKMVKSSLLPGPIFSPSFLSMIQRNFQDFSGTLIMEAQKWNLYKEIHYVKNFSTIGLLIKSKEFINEAKSYNMKFLMGLKLLKLVGEKFIMLLPSFLYQWMLEFIISKTRIEFKIHDSNCRTSFDNFGVEFKDLCAKADRLGNEEITLLFRAIDESLKDFKLLKDNKSSGEKKNNCQNNMQSRDKMHMLVSQISGKATEGPSPTIVYTTLNDVLKKLISGYFFFLKHKAPGFLVTNFKEIEGMVNPDLPGFMYNSFDNLKVQTAPLYTTKIFFDVMKERQTRNDVVSILEEYSQLIQEQLEDINNSIAGKKGKKKRLTEINLFIYNQQLFEHLKMTNLTHSNVYKIDKLFFSKFDSLKKINN